MGSPRRSTTITKVGTKAAFSSSSSDSSTAVPNSLPMGSPRRSTTITKVGTTATFSSSSSDSSTAVPNSLPMGSHHRSTTITKVGTTATFSSSSSDSSTVVPKSLPMASLELDVEDPNPSMPDGTTVRHYHTHNNNQTYNIIYVTGGLAAAGLTKQAGQATDGSPDRSVLQKSPTHATLSSPNDGESFSKPNSHALRANPTSAFYSPPKRPGSVSFPLGRSDSATAVTASLDNNKESTTKQTGLPSWDT
ncbi:hypothetical protein IV203_005975 [Nitzschia inconspicua]|uniref:Uncharacterized protein n=1 Tax=Nitzschia inconspicua TaxID=303405 RepID=A0A9K3KP42_9STRA|nr:hypothetical protein IV203_005975 [Nitzschia inconspicua]